MSEGNKRVFLTGASGLLGRAIYTKFKKEGWNVYGVAFSRVKEGYHKLDLTDKNAVTNAILDFKPSLVIHSAAQRYPDLVEKNPDEANAINVSATEYVAEASNSIRCKVIYISTDYVFDGKKPPYDVDSEPNPLNLYGKTKLLGEKVTSKINPSNIILRIPILYGPVEKLEESAVTILLKSLENNTKPTSMSNYERRRPSHVDDIALICFQLGEAVVKEGLKLEGIFHWCGSEELTKYEMIVKMAQLFNMPYQHIQPDMNASSSAVRPYNSTLCTSRLVKLGFGQHTPFDEGIYNVLYPWTKKN